MAATHWSTALARFWVALWLWRCCRRPWFVFVLLFFNEEFIIVCHLFAFYTKFSRAIGSRCLRRLISCRVILLTWIINAYNDLKCSCLKTGSWHRRRWGVFVFPNEASPFLSRKFPSLRGQWTWHDYETGLPGQGPCISLAFPLQSPTILMHNAADH